MTDTDTIVALATASGRAGIAIVRISGPQTPKIMHNIIGKTLKPRLATHVAFHDHEQNIIDVGLGLFFPQPHSFTGEDVLELHGHGGSLVTDLLINAIIQAGARLAKPGEFSLRAFLNDKIDLLQAEAIADLIDAQTRVAARSAIRSLQGEFSNVINTLVERIINLRLHIEATIDFSDEDIDFMTQQFFVESLQAITNDFNCIEMQAKQGSLIREGVKVVIIGKPNVGKSSLLNRLSGRELAIVTDVPGTTRDIVQDHIHLDGMPLHICDTAGLRDSEDVVEREGIKRAYAALDSADIILYVMDATDDTDPKQQLIAHDERYDERYLFIQNKMDLIASHNFDNRFNDEKPIIKLSAKTGEGIAELIAAIKTKAGLGQESQGLFLARRRHLVALQQAKMHIQNCTAHLQPQRVELAAEELRLAQQLLNEITGEFSADDLLGRIFANFCIGK